MITRLRRLWRSSAFAWTLVLLGVLLRLRQYLYNRSLWGDEFMLAANLVERSFADLARPLSLNQGAPMGFLFLSKASISMFGTSEYALRLIPLVSGLLALFIFHRVAKRVLSAGAVPVALCLFAVSRYLVYYSSELKQYSTDVAVALLLYWLVFASDEETLTPKRAALLAAVGALALWFSYPCVFVLAAMGAALLVGAAARKDMRELGYISAVGLCWGLSFAVLYFVGLRQLGSNAVLLKFWSHTFAPVPPKSLDDARWFASALVGLFNNPVGMKFAGLAAFAFLAGCVSLLLGRWTRLLSLLLPLFLALVASALRKYPFTQRFLLFCVPSFVLLMAEGARFVMARSRAAHGAIGFILVVLLLLYPCAAAAYHVAKPLTKEEMKQVLAYVSENLQEGDLLCVHRFASGSFRYYAPRFRPELARAADNDLDPWLGEEALSTLAGRDRVWVILVYPGPIGLRQKERVLGILDSMGREVDSIQCPGASASLYDLRDSALPASKRNATILEQLNR